MNWLEPVLYCIESYDERDRLTDFKVFYDGATYVEDGDFNIVGEGKIEEGARILIVGIGIFVYLGRTIMGSHAFNSVPSENGDCVYVEDGMKKGSAWILAENNWIMINRPSAVEEKPKPKGTKVKTLQGGQGLGSIEDIHPSIEPKDKWGPRTHPETEPEAEGSKDDAYERAMRVLF